MGLAHPELPTIEVSIVGNQLDTLEYRVLAVASLRAGDAAASAGAAAREGPAQAYAEPSAGPASGSRGAAWSAAVRALRERQLAEVEEQRARLVALTGREWQLAVVEFDAPSTLPTQSHAARQISLVLRVVLRAMEPTLH